MQGVVSVPLYEMDLCVSVEGLIDIQENSCSVQVFISSVWELGDDKDCLK